MMNMKDCANEEKNSSDEFSDPETIGIDIKNLEI